MDWPLESSSIHSATLSRKYLSWVMAITVPSYLLKCCSSHATDSASRWFVGSSSKSMSGFCKSRRHRATRLFSPPEIIFTGVSSGGHPSASIAILSLESRSQASSRSSCSWILACFSIRAVISSSELTQANCSEIFSYWSKSSRVCPSPCSTTSRTVFVLSTRGSCSR